MTNTKKVLYMSLLSVLALNNSFADALTNEQLSNLEISGVKIGMTEAEATSGLMQKYGVSKDQLKFRTNPFPHEITGEKKVLSYIEYNGEGENAYIKFMLDVSQNPPINVVYQARYDMRYTKDNADNVEEAMKLKYGNPSISGSNGNFFWCQLKDQYTCIKDINYLMFSRSQKIEILLENDGYSKAITDFKNKKKSKTANF